jgi:O-antigen/teichoic acid export membrane protein
MSNSRTFKAGVLASGTFLTTCVRLISAVVLARLLTIYDYATYRQTLLAYAFAAPLLMLGLPQALYYFLPGEKEQPRSRLADNLILLSIMGALFTLFLLFGGNRLLAWRFKNPDLARTLLVLAPYPLFMLPISAVGACLVARNRVKHAAFFNVLSSVFKLSIILSAVMIWRTPLAAIVGTVVAAGLILLPALKLMFACCEDGSILPSTDGMWSQLKYAVPLGLAGFIGRISVSLDKIIVSSMCPPEEFAVYVNGAFEIPLIGILTGSVMAVLVPEFVQMYKADRHQDLSELWHRAMIKCSLFIMPVMVFLFLMAPEVIRILFSDKYVDSVHPFRVYLLALPVRITTFGTIFMAAGRNRLVVYRAATGLIVNLVLSIIFVRMMGSIGAAISTVVMVYLWVVPYSLFFISRILKKDILHIMPLGILTKVLAVSIGAGLILLLAPLVRPLGDFLTLSILGPSYAAVVLLFFVHFKLVDTNRMVAAVRRMLSRR